MFDRVGDLAEKVATHVSRRAFLGRLGQGTLGLAAIVGGVLGLPAHSRANPKQFCCTGVTSPLTLCKYEVPGKIKVCNDGSPPYPCDSSSLAFCPTN